ncbi:unnamed protein product [Acanthoscelides obtectus]|uniref:PiggyBac transposable element-derived protein domain-containing protein n=1 Tax=Acanthoscelides obtectus TaxID=200917 RepID=A0A9P0K0Z8_ACAOB|nr:unnamed protein product [Acanthoscelides obtectus]CAK1669729.1 hypothetical protein AOBTE_LOCUS27207 [Acanthoscelides obtectus]
MLQKHYIEDLLSCFKYTFSKCRQDSQYQSIDESVTKWGRSSLKQYMPLKPTKRGIKLWLRCDADAGQSVNLLLTLDYAALGTYMSNRKNVPTMGDKLQKGESQFRCTSSGLLYVKWQDTMEVLLMSNCHKPNLTTIIKKSKTGEQQNIQCPEIYRKDARG